MTSHYEERALALRQSLGRSQGLTGEVRAILETFHERLGKLEDAVLPVEARETPSLRRIRDSSGEADMNSSQGPSVS